MTWLVLTTLKVSVILGLALAAVGVLRKRSAELRHAVLVAGVVCACATPVLVLFTPPWGFSIPLMVSDLRLQQDPLQPIRVTASGGPSEIARQGAKATPRLAPVSGAPAEAEATTDGALLSRAVVILWATGVVVHACMLFVGLRRLRLLTARSRPLATGAWTRLAGEVAATYGLRRRIVWLQSDDPTLVVTWGWVRPTVVVPGPASDWSVDRARIVLMHELAHVSRGDWVTQLIAECLRCVYWFNPLTWVICQRLRQESERACDDAVLRGGVDGITYATHLLAVARAVKHRGRQWLPAPAIVRPSNLERRIVAMMNPRLSRSRITFRSHTLAFVSLTCAALVVAGLGVVAQTGTISGFVLDQAEYVVPDATVTLVARDRGDRVSIESDATGRFAFDGLAAGRYQLIISAPGFARRFHSVPLDAGEQRHEDIALQLGSLEETIAMVYGGSEDVPVPAMASPGTVERVRRARPEGTIQPAIKLVDLAPHLPEAPLGHALETKIVLEGLIATDGFVKVQRILATVDPESMTTVHPEMARAAVAAVNAWRYEPTRLHGVPVDTLVNISVSFTPAE